MVQNHSLLVSVESISPSSCILKDNGQNVESSNHEQQLSTGGCGAVTAIGANVQNFQISDTVMICLPDLARGEAWKSTPIEVHATLASKYPPTSSKHHASRLPIPFALATAILHNLHSPPLLNSPIESPPPPSILVIGDETPLHLFTIKLLNRLSASIFVVYEPDTVPDEPLEAFSVVPATLVGCHFVQKPEVGSNIANLAKGLKANLARYGPARDKTAFDLVVDLTGEETHEAYVASLGADGVLFRLPQILSTDFKALFLEGNLMAELGALLEREEMKPGDLYVRPEEWRGRYGS